MWELLSNTIKQITCICKVYSLVKKKANFRVKYTIFYVKKTIQPIQIQWNKQMHCEHTKHYLEYISHNGKIWEWIKVSQSKSSFMLVADLSKDLCSRRNEG